jgi:hypothetical protein
VYRGGGGQPPSPPAWVSYAIIIVASVLIVAMTMVFL